MPGLRAPPCAAVRSRSIKHRAAPSASLSKASATIASRRNATASVAEWSGIAWLLPSPAEHAQRLIGSYLPAQSDPPPRMPPHAFGPRSYRAAEAPKAHQGDPPTSDLAAAARDCQLTQL